MADGRLMAYSENRREAHDDLDIALPHAQVARLRALLSTRGFREQRRADSWEYDFVLADEVGRRLDVHSYSLEAAGLNIGERRPEGNSSPATEVRIKRQGLA